MICAIFSSSRLRHKNAGRHVGLNELFFSDKTNTNMHYYIS